MTDREIFMNAPLGAPQDVLDAYLDEACGDNQDLRENVQALLASDDGAPEFMEVAPLDDVPTSSGSPVTTEETPGTVIGNYKLLQKIGEGGFGVVFMAEQLRPVKRRVALKIIKLGMDTKQVVARFEAERQALAMMDHPQIAKVLDAGATEMGRPYFVMELVRGIPITTFCDEQKLDTEARLQLFMDVCSAVQHAHQKGIIHRDLKPSNVMVTLHDDKAVPKVIDFGVAKATQSELTDMTLYTRYEQFIGTPAYMSPEQAQMSGLDIDTRSDIYSLGVLLYELLTGTTPFDAREFAKVGQDEIRRVIREDEPPKPSTRLSQIRTGEGIPSPAKLPQSGIAKDLDWIAMKAIEKDRSRRYDTAHDLALDVRRHLANEPVTAAAPSALYRFRKYARRNRAVLGVAALVVGALAIGAVVSTMLAIQKAQALLVADEAREDAIEAQGVLETEKEIVDFRLAEEYLSTGKRDLGLAYLARTLRRNPTNRSAAERMVSALVYGDFHRQITRFDTDPPGLPMSPCATFTGDGATIVSPIKGVHAVFSWDVGTGKILDRLADYPKEEGRTSYDMADADFYESADGTRLMLAAADWGPTPAVTIWDLKTGTTKMHVEGLNREIVRFSPDGTRLLCVGWGGCTVLDVETGEELCFFDGHADHSKRNWMSDCTWSPDGSLVATAAIEVCVWDPEKGEMKAGGKALDPGGFTWSVDFSADGRYLATGSTNHSAQIWNLATGGRHGPSLEHKGRVDHVRFSPDGSVLATASKSARLWDVATGLPLTEPLPHPDKVWWLDFNRRGNKLATATLSGKVRLWDVGTGRPLGSQMEPRDRVWRIQFSPDDESLFIATLGGSAGLWKAPETRPRSLIMRHQQMNYHIGGGLVSTARFLDEDTVFSSAWDSTVRLWNARSGELLDTPRTHHWDVRLAAADINTARDRVAFALRQHGVGLARKSDDGSWEHEELSKDNYDYVEFSADGKYLVAAGRSGPTRIWELTDPQCTPVGQFGDVSSLRYARFSPDGRHFVTAEGQRAARVMRVDGDVMPASPLLGEHPSAIKDVFFSPDGRLVATACEQGRVQIWEWATGKPTLNPSIQCSSGAISVRFSPDGERMVVASEDGTARIWEVDSGEPVGIPLLHDDVVWLAVFSPDGSRVATASRDGTARLWEVATGLPISEPFPHDEGSHLFSVGFSPSGERLITAGNDASLRIWDVPPVPERVPEWVLEWVEAVAGKQVDDDDEGTVRPLRSSDMREITAAAASREGDEYYDWIARWFYHDNAETRNISPFTRLEMQSVVENEIATNQLKSLEEAVWLSPGNPQALLTLAGRLGNRFKGTDPVGLRRAKFYARQAMSLGEKEPAEEILATVAEHEARIGFRRAFGRFKERGAVALQSADESTTPSIRTALALGELLVLAESGAPSLDEMEQALRALMDMEGAPTVPIYLPEGSTWRYLSDGSDPGATWFRSDFDDSKWASGSAPLGFGDHQTTVIMDTPTDANSPTAFYFRHVFEMEEDFLPEGDSLLLRIQCDDGAAVYLNGREAARVNLPTGSLGPATLASSVIGGAREKQLQHYMIGSHHLRAGSNHVAVVVYQTKPESSDVSFDLELAKTTRAAGYLANLPPERYDEAFAILRLLAPADLLQGSPARWRFLVASDPEPDDLNESRNSVETWKRRCEVQALLRRESASRSAVDAAIELHLRSGDPGAAKSIREHKELLRFKADVLTYLGRWEEASAVKRDMVQIPPRNPSLGPRLIDLTDHYTGLGFFHYNAPAPRTALFQWERLPETFDGSGGIPFDLRGWVALNSGVYTAGDYVGKDFNGQWGSKLPYVVKGIKIDQTCQKIHFLQCCKSGYEAAGTPVAFYTVHYTDGTAKEVEVIYGKDIVDSIVHRLPPGVLGGVEHIAWRQPYRRGGSRAISLTRQTWENPHPEKMITHIDFTSAKKNASPHLAGITLE